MQSFDIYQEYVQKWFLRMKYLIRLISNVKNMMITFLSLYSKVFYVN
jgi:hypothetical protein